MEYLSELARYPCPNYCACCFIPCPQEFMSQILMCAMVVIYVIGSAIEYYLFLLFYMFLMLLTKIFSSCFSCKSSNVNVVIVPAVPVAPVVVNVVVVVNVALKRKKKLFPLINKIMNKMMFV